MNDTRTCDELLDAVKSRVVRRPEDLKIWCPDAEAIDAAWTRVDAFCRKRIAGPTATILDDLKIVGAALRADPHDECQKILAEVTQLLSQYTERDLRAGPPGEPPDAKAPLTSEEWEEYRFLEQLMSRSGRFDNYEPSPADDRRWQELKSRVSGGAATPEDTR